jgi:ABC-type antimicrobial peptide transport system permease subunit
MYFPWAQQFSPQMVLQVRLANGTAVERMGVRTAVQAIDPALALGAVATMDDDMRLSLLPTRIGASLLGAFGILALFLATIGVYGVTAYLVGQRTAEIGIRSALGATSRNVLGLMMRDTVKLVLIGLGLGLAGGIGIGAVISGWLFGVKPVDPLALGGASAVLVSVAVLATLVPARRALRVDPIKALRSE